MRLSVSVALLASLSLQQASAFVPLSATRDAATSSTQRPVLPTSISLDIPSWLVDASTQVDSMVPQLLLPPIPSSEGLDSLVAALKELDPSILTTAATVPWHLEVIAVFAAGNIFLQWLNGPDGEQLQAPYAAGSTTYSPEAAAEFFGKRPLLVVKRILRLALLTGAFNTGVLFDWLVLGKLLKDEQYTALKKAEPKRAKAALALCERLGPTFIKLGQALSIRTDLIPEAYALELRKLQDAVPPFPSDQARQVICKELGINDLSQVFSTLSPEPVASASIGQVYRGTLASNGKDVAVKVQRPGILAEIALDLHVLRVLTPIQTILQNAVNGVQTTQADIDTAILLVDEWGRGFVAETDYVLEAKNTMDFGKAMANRGLESVCAPTVVESLVRNKLLVTEWVQGTRLDRDASPDVPRLCGVAINAYLTMLLDTGVLHCDPHVRYLRA
jgi:ABC1 atypical kinase-like domain